MDNPPQPTPPPSLPPSQPGPTQGGGARFDRRSLGETIAELQPHVAAELAALLPPVSGVLLLLFDRSRPLVRFHAIQNIVFGVGGLLVMAALGILGGLTIIPLIDGFFRVVLSLISVIFGLGYLVVYTIAMVRAFCGAEWDIPWIGPFARNLIKPQS